MFPNPIIDRVTVAIEINSKEKLNLSLYNMEGQLVTQFYNSTPKRLGKLNFSFELTSLSAGSYIFTATQGGQEIVSKTLVKG